MKILITGHEGFIGSHLYKLLPKAIGMDHVIYGQDIRYDRFPRGEFSHIFHLAALRSVPLGEEIPLDFIETNCWGTYRLLKAYPNARIINVSSSSVEGKSLYGLTKKFAEEVGNTHKNCLNVRLYNVFGEGQTLESGAVVPHLIDCYLNNKIPTLYGYGKMSRDFTYVGDVVLELKRLMFETKKTGTTHVGYGCPIQVRNLASLIGNFKKLNLKSPRGDYEIQFSKAPIAIKNPKYGREEGIKRTIKWWREKCEKDYRLTN